jgi:NAD(P)-dependent dehydrogenase (short-subunit alcohol dehydrogenase family)
VARYDLDGQVAIVTGASSGLGREFSLALAESGAQVVLAARREELLVGLAEEIEREHGVRALAVRTDVTREADIVALVERTVAELGTVDILVNNAGVYVFKPLVEQTLEDWRTVMDVNLTSAFLASREVAKVMIPKRSGCIVNIASTSGFGAMRFTEVSYYASKGGMVMLTKALAIELGPSDIRVNAIAPGFFPTPMSIAAMTDETIRTTVIEHRTALPRLAENEWIRGAVCFLASDDARFITGHTLVVDGGWLAF